MKNLFLHPAQRQKGYRICTDPPFGLFRAEMEILIAVEYEI